MVRPKAKVETGLKNKGFKKTEGDHHYFAYVTLEGKVTSIKTKTSHTPKMKDIPDNILSQMAKQCQLSKSDFLALIDCSFSQESYELRLKQERKI